MLVSTPIRTWHVVLSGFLQKKGQPTGMARLWLDLHNAHADAQTAVIAREWDADMDSLAEWIWRVRPLYGPTIKIYGYSWGGAAALELCRRLRDRGLKVEHLVLSDAVYRHKYWLGNWRALWSGATLVVPDNVKRVDAWRQERSRPAGHRIEVESPQTFRNVDMAGVSHQYMDDLRIFHLRSRGIAGV